MTKRRYKKGVVREQLSLLPPCIEDYVDEDNPVRAIEAFVNSLDLAELDFAHCEADNHAGQPPFDPASLLKLYLYGYLNSVRSSRRLERESARNLEVIWLMGGLKPSYKTIANFRKDNADGLKAVNKTFVQLCHQLKLFGGALVAIDGSHFNGNASKSSIITAKNLDDKIRRMEAHIAAYQDALASNDADDETAQNSSLHKDADLPAKLKQLQARLAVRKEQQKKLKESGEGQYSGTDPDARLLNKGNGTVAGYNVQSVVDEKHKLIVASEVTNDGTDLHQLHPMSQLACEALGAEAKDLEVLVDAGFYDASQLEKCEEDGFMVYAPEPKKSKSEADGRFTKQAFVYDSSRDAYQCPGKKWLEKQGGLRQNNGHPKYRYASKGSDCKACPLKKKCLSDKGKRREIYCYPGEQETVIAAHKKRMATPKAQDKMRQRSAIVEHPFGTLKCRSGWQHFLVRGFKKVRGEWSLMVTCYNFTRVLNIIGIQDFIEFCTQNPSFASFLDTICPLKTPYIRFKTIMTSMSLKVSTIDKINA